MERFNYPNLAAAEAEDMSILRLLELESYGKKRDDQEELDEAEARSEYQGGGE